MARLTDALRRRVAKDQRGLCWYCALPLRDDMTWEHLVARRHGGDDSFANVAYIAHQACNSRIGTLPPALKWTAHDVGWTYGSDAFFLLLVQWRALTNAHDDYRDLRRRRPKPPPRGERRAALELWSSRLPPEVVSSPIGLDIAA